MPIQLKATTTTVGVVATSVATLMGMNANRLGGSIFNDTGTVVYILLGDGVVSPTFYTQKLSTSDQFWQLPDQWTGKVTAIRNSGTTPQPMYVTEYEAA